VRKSLSFSSFETRVIKDQKSVFTLGSYALAAAMYLNLSALNSALVGVVATIFYFLINGIFLGHTFFREEPIFFRLALGNLMHVALLAFFGLIVLIAYNLDTVRFTLVLLITATVSSLPNKWVKRKNAH